MGQAHLYCHPEQAFGAPRGIWAVRAKCRVLYDAILARLARFLIFSYCGATLKSTVFEFIPPVRT